MKGGAVEHGQQMMRVRGKIYNQSANLNRKAKVNLIEKVTFRES